MRFELSIGLSGVVFFVKQKTAYELRISDWSSDLCSSDLGARSASRTRRRIARRLDARSAPGQPAMRAIFIRHGQSTGNAGVPCDDLGAIELTELGQEQAREVAASWTQAPALIVTSPYTRTRQTAAPTIARFPGVPVEVWPIEEFTYLQPARWNGTRSAERMPHLERYWSAADPDYCDGEGAESFSTLLRRCEAALTRLAAM